MKSKKPFLVDYKCLQTAFSLSWELGVGSWELGDGSWEMGVWSWEMGVWRLEFGDGS